MKRLLMIAYDFPPLLPGVRRTLSLVRYLPEFDWQPSILTVKSVHCWAHDETPLKEIEEKGIEVFRADSWDPFRLAYLLDGIRNRRSNANAHGNAASATGGLGAKWLRHLRNHCYCPDDRSGWIDPAYRLARKIISTQPPDAIYSTSFPHSSHVVALRLKKAFPDIPWLADFRDAWTQNADFFHSLSPRLQAKGVQLEREVAARADAIVSVSEPITNHFRKLLGASAKPIITIPNGFDERDVEIAEAQQWDGFSVLYAGTIFGGRSADPLFAAAAEACRIHAELARELKLVFVGKFDKNLTDLSQKYGLSDRLVMPGTLPYLKSLGAQKGADVLVALVTDMPDVEVMLTQKIFEYIATGRPVWALADSRSACAELVKTLGAGVVCDPANPAEGARGLIDLYEKVKQKQWRRVDRDALAPYSRRNQAERMAQILHSLVAPEAKKP